MDAVQPLKLGSCVERTTQNIYFRGFTDNFSAETVGQGF